MIERNSWTATDSPSDVRALRECDPWDCSCTTPWNSNDSQCHALIPAFTELEIKKKVYFKEVDVFVVLDFKHMIHCARILQVLQVLKDAKFRHQRAGQASISEVPVTMAYCVRFCPNETVQKHGNGVIVQDTHTLGSHGFGYRRWHGTKCRGWPTSGPSSATHSMGRSSSSGARITHHLKTTKTTIHQPLLQNLWRLSSTIGESTQTFLLHWWTLHF